MIQPMTTSVTPRRVTKPSARTILSLIVVANRSRLRCLRSRSGPVAGIRSSPLDAVAAGPYADCSDHATGRGTLMAADFPPRCLVVGTPVSYGLEMFKNRQAQREQIRGWLADPTTRVVTVFGPRGIGKSA